MNNFSLNTVSERIAQLREALHTPVTASPETDYTTYDDQVSEIYAALVHTRKEGLDALYDDSVPLLDHADASIRQQAFSTLTHLSQSDPGRRTRLRERASEMWTSDPDGLVRTVALRMWAEPYRNTGDRDVLARLAPILYDTKEDGFVRREANFAVLETSGMLDRIRAEDPTRARSLLEEDEMSAVPTVDWPLIASILVEAGVTVAPDAVAAALGQAEQMAASSAGQLPLGALPYGLDLKTSVGAELARAYVLATGRFTRSDGDYLTGRGVVVSVNQIDPADSDYRDTYEDAYGIRPDLSVMVMLDRMRDGDLTADQTAVEIITLLAHKIGEQSRAELHEAVVFIQQGEAIILDETWAAEHPDLVPLVGPVAGMSDLRGSEATRFAE